MIETGEILVVLLAALLASGIQAVTGFGYAITSTTILAFFLRVDEITLVILLSSFVVFGSITYQLYRTQGVTPAWRLMVIPIVGTIVGRFIGVMLLTSLSQRILVLLMTASVLGIAAYFLLIEHRLKARTSQISGLFAGGLSGVLGGLFNFSGPPLVAYFRRATEEPAVYMATLQITLAAGALYSLVFHLIQGNYDGRMTLLSVIASLGVLLGSYVGHRLFLHVPRELFRKVVNYSVVALSVVILVRNLVG